MNEIDQKNIRFYGTLISSSFEIECKPLISCLDDILKIFDDYLKLIAKVNFFNFFVVTKKLIIF
jgi:hypothetical protein